MTLSSFPPPLASHGIEFQGVCKRFGTADSDPLVVDHISFAVPRGTLTTILGPSGCGKTTTLRMIAGLESPTAGRIFIDGHDVTTLGPAQRNVSLVFQSYALFPHMNVIDNVCYGLRMSGLGKAQVREKARAMLDTVGLHGLDQRRPAELSGGQQQRVALARALALEPAVLLFDEPLSNLDARLRRAMREEIRTLQQRLSLTVAYVTHDQSEALAVSDQIIVMNKGAIAQRGAPSELYEQPASEFVAGFMGEAMLFEGTNQASQPPGGAPGHADLGPLRVPSPPSLASGPVKIAVRPEAWIIGPATTAGLAARLTKRTYLGSIMEYTFASALGEIFVVSPLVKAPLDVGAPVSLTLADHGVSVVAG
ncbi:sugar ABC transporter substrate-binding protein [Acidovorax sp. Leaf76]|uniref:ABC transporter ATP-binding protein n=1 Tax=unclassified Acidovorax TaxID=2684926 RepID=UPI000702085D|nr:MULTISPECIES: ABC transporter ATP-binding protein [unclassified Acidovorax]KQO25584.1 sugar ABC transporter substrate-binding protein [Acidovorax sp. Leaf76]KQO29267.1 sugar ABC transporter substrate-binding protein [Acidovorax sp. Leaf84]KQS25790.1 sugar ABC transporter substrate-binding protein [Acidovorax sp. Leaf191]